MLEDFKFKVTQLKKEYNCISLFLTCLFLNPFSQISFYLIYWGVTD